MGVGAHSADNQGLYARVIQMCEGDGSVKATDESDRR